VDEEERETSWNAEALEIRDSIIELWRLIRMAQLTNFDTNASARPSDNQCDRIYSELQMEVEMLSLTLGQDLPNEILEWLSFKHLPKGPPPRRK
jgi:hypothetical protein